MRPRRPLTEQQTSEILAGIAAGKRIEDILATLGLHPSRLYNERRCNSEFEAAILAAYKMAPQHSKDARAQSRIRPIGAVTRPRDAALRAALFEAVKAGCTIRDASVRAGCSLATTYRLRRDDPEWDARLVDASHAVCKGTGARPLKALSG